MTYAGLGAILFRFIGLLLFGVQLFSLLPAVFVGGAHILGQTFMISGIFLLPAVILIIASKPLGRLLAAGLE